MDLSLLLDLNIERRARNRPCKSRESWGRTPRANFVTCLLCRRSKVGSTPPSSHAQGAPPIQSGGVSSSFIHVSPPRSSHRRRPPSTPLSGAHNLTTGHSVSSPLAVHVLPIWTLRWRFVWWLARDPPPSILVWFVYLSDRPFSRITSLPLPEPFLPLYLSSRGASSLPVSCNGRVLARVGRRRAVASGQHPQRRRRPPPIWLPLLRSFWRRRMLPPPRLLPRPRSRARLSRPPPSRRFIAVALSSVAALFCPLPFTLLLFPSTRLLVAYLKLCLASQVFGLPLVGSVNNAVRFGAVRGGLMAASISSGCGTSGSLRSVQTPVGSDRFPSPFQSHCSAFCQDSDQLQMPFTASKAGNMHRPAPSVRGHFAAIPTAGPARESAGTGVFIPRIKVEKVNATQGSKRSVKKKHPLSDFIIHLVNLKFQIFTVHLPVLTSNFTRSTSAFLFVFLMAPEDTGRSTWDSILMTEALFWSPDVTGCREQSEKKQGTRNGREKERAKRLRLPVEHGLPQDWTYWDDDHSASLSPLWSVTVAKLLIAYLLCFLAVTQNSTRRKMEREESS